jgi:transcriptional regulator with XRE-family HTH domain
MNNRVKILRKELGYSQEDFASKLNISRSHVASMENGIKNITDRVVFDICREFSVNEGWLRTGEGEIFVKRDRGEELAAWAGNMLNPKNDGSFQQRFVHMLSKLGEDDWKVLEKMAILMAEENEKG